MKALFVSLFALTLGLALLGSVEAFPPAKGIPSPKPSGKTKAIKPKFVTHAKGAKAVKGPQAVQVGDSLTYINLPVNSEGGTQLLDSNGQPLRATQVLAWAPEVHWTPGANIPAITSPLGQGGSAGAAFRYPGANVWGVVLDQPGHFTQNVQATSQGAAAPFPMSNAADIIANVNDSRGGYLDNGGAFDLVIQIVGL
jgi:hypothetical protein